MDIDAQGRITATCSNGVSFSASVDFGVDDNISVIFSLKDGKNIVNARDLQVADLITLHQMLQSAIDALQVARARAAQEASKRPSMAYEKDIIASLVECADWPRHDPSRQSVISRAKSWLGRHRSWDWMPIADAPKDGTQILVRGPSGYTNSKFTYASARFVPDFRDDWIDESNTRLSDSGLKPTEWRWLP